jgi:hypothetical protein
MRTDGKCNGNGFDVPKMLDKALRNKILNAAVIEADGCGTVVIDDPDMISEIGFAVGGHKTGPVPDSIEKIGIERVLDPDTGEIDQFGGVNKAFAMHYHTVAVVVSSSDDARDIRDCFGMNTIIIAVIRSADLSEKNARDLFEFCDVIVSNTLQNMEYVAPENVIAHIVDDSKVYTVTDVGEMIVDCILEE